MSEENVRAIIIKAYEDLEFRKQLLADPAKAIEGYELNEVERDGLLGISEDFFDESLELEERVSRAGGWN